MAISYDLDMATTFTVEEVASAVVDVARGVGLYDASATTGSVLEGRATGPGTWVRVVEEKPQPWHPVITDFGITPTVSVVFRLGKTGEASDQQDDVVRLVSGLLDRVPGDAVLHFQFEDVWLLRRDRELSLSEREDLWPPRRRRLVDQPYRREPHAFA